MKKLARKSDYFFQKRFIQKRSLPKTSFLITNIFKEFAAENESLLLQSLAAEHCSGCCFQF